MPGNRQSVRDVLCALPDVKGVEVEAGNHALCQLLEFGLRQHVAQLGLPDQHNLQQLAFTRFQIG